MKVALCSDLHLEFGDIDLKNTEGADVLILSGDICVAKELPFSDSLIGERFRNFFKRVSEEFPNVIMIAGNHEHYHGDITTTNQILKDAVKDYPNFDVLEKECVIIGGVTFIGATLWTDMNQGDRSTSYCISKSMNDFRLIKNSHSMVSYKKVDEDGCVKFQQKPSTFTVQDAMKEHENTLEYIDVVTRDNKDQKFVVVGHHAPSKLSTHPRYVDDTLMNGGYSSSLDFFIEDRPQIKLWTHGHTHSPFSYKIGDTMIECNPRGYAGHEQSAYDFKLKFIDIE